jgi:predicted ribosomally synthesized peptide with nif11-like leader
MQSIFILDGMFQMGSKNSGDENSVSGSPGYWGGKRMQIHFSGGAVQMNEQMKKFLEEAAQDKELQSELMKVARQNLAEMAKRRGYDLKPEDFDADQELSADELDAVAGGGGCGCFIAGGGSDGSICFLGGGDGLASGAKCTCYLIGASSW